MHELVVISGKGGTGKTTLLAAFASLARKKVLCDADVDASDLHLIMNPRIHQRHDFKGGHTALINQDKCTGCGICRDVCRFDAINENFKVNPLSCEGCGVCHYFCPEEAVDLPQKTCGEWYISDTRFGPLAHARLGVAEENSGRLVTLIRKQGKELAERMGLDLMLTDGPPGIGCPVIASLGGATAVLIVAEPSLSGLHDMERVAQLAHGFNVPTMTCVNKFDLNPDQARAIESMAERKNVAVMGRIPFDPIFTKSMIMGRTLFEYDSQSNGALSVKSIWEKVFKSLKNHCEKNKKLPD